MIARLTETLLLKVGKEGVARLLKEPLLEKAATNTQLDFEGLEIRDTLLKWSQSQNLIEILEDLKRRQEARGGRSRPRISRDH